MANGVPESYASSLQRAFCVIEYHAALILLREELQNVVYIPQITNEETETWRYH